MSYIRVMRLVEEVQRSDVDTVGTACVACCRRFACHECCEDLPRGMYRLEEFFVPGLHLMYQGCNVV